MVRYSSFQRLKRFRRTVVGIALPFFASQLCASPASAQNTVTTTLERLTVAPHSGCTRVRVHVTGPGIQDVHVWVAQTNHTPLEEKTLGGDPVAAHWTVPPAPGGFVFNGINRHNNAGAIVGGPGQPVLPTDVDWFADWSGAAALPPAGGDFDLIYCGGTGGFRPKEVRLTKNGGAGAGWTTADLLEVRTIDPPR
jgi:hypothetical protein